MIGFLLAIGLFFVFPGAVLGRTMDFEYGGPGALAILALVVFVAAFFVGMLLVQTVGVASTGYMAGAVVGALLALFTNQAQFFLPLLLHAVVGFVVGHIQQARMGYAAAAHYRSYVEPDDDEPPKPTWTPPRI